MTTLNQSAVAASAPLALIERAPLAAALASACRVVERRNTIPILSNVRLIGSGESMAIEGTDLDIWIRVDMPAAADKRFAATVSAVTLRDLVKDSGADYVEATGGDRLALDFEGAKSALPTLPVADWPEIHFKSNASHAFTMPAATLRRMFSACQMAISTEETRYYLNGIFMHPTRDEFGKPVLRAAATDGHRLARATVADIPDGAGSMPGVIVPRKTVAIVLAELKAKGAPAAVDIELSEAWISFKLGATVIRSKLVDGTFPDYSRVIPSGNDKAATVEAKPFAAMVKAVGKVAARMSHAVRLGFEPVDNAGMLEVSANNPDTGSASQCMALESYVGDGLEIGFNAKYLGDIVASIGADRLVIRLGDSGSPARFEPAESPADGVDVIAVCMPVRV